MAKIYGLFGAMTGKLADTVMSVRNGEQIARKYQPVVYNPSTPAQVAQRAKLKLMSQLSAVVAPYIAIPRVGNVSSRNLFTKKNYPLTSYASDQADITLTSVQLTNSNVGLPTFTAYRDQATGAIYAEFSEAVEGFSRVVYVTLPKGSDGKLRQGTSVVVSTPGAGSTYSSQIATFPEECVILAYAIRDNTEAARATFGNMTVTSAEIIAKLIVTRTLTEADITLSETVGITILQYTPNREDDNQRSSQKKK